MQTISDWDGEGLTDAPLSNQVVGLERAVLKNPVSSRILERLAASPMPNWYLGAGAITQTVWNLRHGFPVSGGIKDYDIIYFDAADLTATAERAVKRGVARLVGRKGVELDVVNEARVHLWFREKFGVDCPPYQSSEHAISTWPTTASSIGVRYEDGRFVVCAPWGLRDVFSLVVRRNPDCPDRSACDAKFARWSARWPGLRLVST
jgi:uncharacterized protein